MRNDTNANKLIIADPIGLDLMQVPRPITPSLVTPPNVWSPDGWSPETILGPLRALNRASDGFIGFGRMTTNGWQNLFSYQFDQLEANLPELLPLLSQDAYFTVNSMYRAAPYPNQITGRPDLWRKEKNLRSLNACYVDLDVGRGSPNSLTSNSLASRSLASNSSAPNFPNGDSLTWQEASMAITDLIDEGHLPQCSLSARSGRGLYLFWLLQSEDDPSLPPRAYSENLRLYKAINRCIAQKLQFLSADRNAVDAARVLRVPGTLHSKCGQSANYTIHHDGEDNPFTYTLSELSLAFTTQRPFISLSVKGRTFAAQSVLDEIEETGRFGSDHLEIGDIEPTGVTPTGVNPREVNPTGVTPTVAVFGRPIKNPGSAVQRSEGAKALNLARSLDLIWVYKARGGWQKGTRQRSLSLCALCFRNAGFDKFKVFRFLKAMAEGCQPPYPSHSSDEPLVAMVARTFSGRMTKLSTLKIINSIGITDEEARELCLQTLLSETVKAEQKRPFGGFRGQLRSRRRDFISRHVKTYGMVSCRQMVSELERAGIPASRQAVNQDLRLLAASLSGNSSLSDDSLQARRKPGRPKKDPACAPCFQLTSELWKRIQPLLPPLESPSKRHPLNCHRPRIDDRAAMSAIFFVLRSGCKWNDLNATQLCNSSTAHRRFKEWQRAGVFERLWEEVVLEEGRKIGIDWRWLEAAAVANKL